MYLFLYSVCNAHHFIAKDNSLYEIAILYQKGLIKLYDVVIDNLDATNVTNVTNTTTNTTTLEVILYTDVADNVADNEDTVKFKENTCYHLYLTPNVKNSNVCITLSFEEDQYVATWYRPDLSEQINKNTCNVLLNGNKCKLIDQSIEYNDKRYFNYNTIDTTNVIDAIDATNETYDCESDLPEDLPDDLPEYLEDIDDLTEDLPEDLDLEYNTDLDLYKNSVYNVDLDVDVDL